MQNLVGCGAKGTTGRAVLRYADRRRRATSRGLGDSVLGRLLLSAGLMGLGASAALAADIAVPESRAPVPPPTYAPIPSPTPYYDWTGFYVGGNVGGGWVFHNHATTTDLVSGATFPEPMDGNFWGFAGGAQVGFNWFVLPSYLIGAEADFSALSNSNTESLVDPSTGASASLNERPEWVSTVRVRVGLTADRFMWYGTGGVAWVQDRLTRTQIGGPAVNNATPGTVETVNHSGVGFAVGTGVEYAVMSHVTARVEFLYIGLGDETFSFPLAQRSTTANFDTIALIRFGLNYKFGGGDPLAAISARD